MITKEKPTGLRGKELLRAAVNQIIQHPETFDQSKWHCDTKHCFAGWCQVLAGRSVNDDTCFKDARTDLGLSEAEATYLFDSFRRLPEIYKFAKSFIEDTRAGYDQAGYNRAGYDRDGYNWAGYNRAGKKPELL